MQHDGMNLAVYAEKLEKLAVSSGPVSYTHLTLPTKA